MGEAWWVNVFTRKFEVDRIHEGPEILPKRFDILD